MAIKKPKILSRADFDQAVVQLRLNVSEIAKEVGIPRTYLSEFRNGDRVLRPEHQAKLRDYFESKGVEFDDASAPEMSPAAPASARHIGRAVPKPAFVLPDDSISADLHPDTVEAIADRLDSNARRIESIRREPVKKAGFLDDTDDDGLTTAVTKLHNEIVQLLAEEALLRRRIEGRCILPPLPADKASAAKKADSQGELLSKKFDHLNQGDLAVSEPDDSDVDPDAAPNGDDGSTAVRSSAMA